MASVLSLPEAMAFGALVFSALGPEHASLGVIAGLTALGISNLVGAFLGGVRIMSTGPYALASLMLASAVPEIQRQAATLGLPGFEGSLLLLLMVVFAAGLMQTLTGLLRLGSLAEAIPYPVVAGLMNGIATLILVGQVHPLLGLDPRLGWSLAAMGQGFQPLTLMVGALTVATILGGARLTRRVPAAILGILLGSLLYVGLRALGMGPLGPLIGEIPRSLPLPVHARSLLTLAVDSEALPVVLDLLPLAAGVAIVVSLRTALAAVTLASITQERSNINRELRGQGIANALSACFGGIAVTGYSGQPIANFQSGGRTRRSRFVVGAFALLVLTLAGPWVGQIPKVVLSGTLVTLGWFSFDRWSFHQLRRLLFRKRSWNLLLEVGVTLGVAGVMIAFGIFEGVGLGVLISAVFFIFRMSRNTIRRHYDGTRSRSEVERVRTETEVLVREGHRIRILELQGSLFFACAERVAEAVEPELDGEASYVILDFQRVTDIDSTGARLLGKLRERAQRRRVRLLLGALSPQTRLGRLADRFGILEDFQQDWFPSLRRALLEAEEGLLDRFLGPGRHQRELELHEIDALAKLSPAEQHVLRALLRVHHYPSGSLIYRQGDPGDSLFFVRSGRIRLIQDPGGPSGEVTVDTLVCPGTTLGKKSLFDGLPRAAGARAEEDASCWELSRADFERLRQDQPHLVCKLFEGLAAELVRRLRLSGGGHGDGD